MGEGHGAYPLTSATRRLGDCDVIDFDDPAWLARERTWCTFAARGDQRAFGSIYDAFSERLYAVIAKDVRNPAHAEDIYCETFRQAFEDIGTFKGERSIWFWLHGIATNRVLKLKRHSARSKRAFAGWGHFVESQEAPDLDAALDWPKHQARLNRCVARLPEDQERAIRLRRYEERSRESCAEAMGMTLNHFDVTYSRAIAALRKLWEADKG